MENLSLEWCEQNVGAKGAEYYQNAVHAFGTVASRKGVSFDVEKATVFKEYLVGRNKFAMCVTCKIDGEDYDWADVITD